MPTARPGESRYLVLAPTGADAVNIGRVLTREALEHTLCRDVPELVDAIALGVGAIILAEEALRPPAWGRLARALEQQPAWSDVPMLVITSSRSADWWAAGADQQLGPRANLSLLERPLRGSALVAAARSALRARQRQYQIRDLIDEREDLLRSLEKRVVERTAKLQELVAELEGFSYTVSHDLRAPLRVMAGYAKALLDDHGAALDPEAKNYVQRIAVAAERMDRLTQDVLAYTRVARDDLALEPVNLDRLVQELLEQYPQLAVARGSIKIARPLAMVLGHPPSLMQALSNLLDNALKFVVSGRPRRVRIATRSRGDTVRILVSDNGPGIDPAYQQQIFGIFERLAPRSVPGTGIGLAIVKKAVERMGGSVGVKSKLGKGAEFWIELPRAPQGSPR